MLYIYWVCLPSPLLAHALEAHLGDMVSDLSYSGSIYVRCRAFSKASSGCEQLRRPLQENIQWCLVDSQSHIPVYC